jgi:hypothetical protein
MHVEGVKMSPLARFRIAHEAETAAQLAGKWLAWDRAYRRFRASHSVKQAALLALHHVGEGATAERLEHAAGGDRCSPPEKS